MGTFKCPTCGYENRDDALLCDMCKAVFRKVPRSTPPETQRAAPPPPAPVPSSKPQDPKPHDAPVVLAPPLPPQHETTPEALRAAGDLFALAGWPQIAQKFFARV